MTDDDAKRAASGNPPAATDLHEDPQAAVEPDPAEKPPVRSYRGLGSGHARSGWRMTFEIYEAVWQAYRDGTQKQTELARKFDLGLETVNKLVKRGYPQRGWASLEERWKQFELEKAAASDKAAIDEAEKDRMSFRAAKRDSLNLSQAAKASIARLIRRVVNDIDEATLKRQKTYRRPDGTMAVIELAPYSPDVADALKTIVLSLNELRAHDSFWLGGPTDRKDFTVNQTGNAAIPPGFRELTDDQLKYIAETGRLPQGVSDEQLFGTGESVSLTNGKQPN